MTALNSPLRVRVRQAFGGAEGSGPLHRDGRAVVRDLLAGCMQPVTLIGLTTLVPAIARLSPGIEVTEE